MEPVQKAHVHAAPPSRSEDAPAVRHVDEAARSVGSPAT